VNYFDAVAHRRLLREYPLRAGFTDDVARRPREELRALQNQRFLRVLRRAWQVPFYRRRWTEAGVRPRDVRSLDDVCRLPAYTKVDLMRSIEAAPPFGDYHGMDGAPGLPVVVQTTSGTTGQPQPLFYGPRSRETQNLLLARAYYFQGLRDADRVHSVYGHGMVNGGHYVRETFLHFTGALFFSAGTGAETRSRTQVELMRRFGATVIVGFVDYVRHLAEVAREMGLDPRRDLGIRMISGHLGRESRESLSHAWGGAQVFDWYGVGDTGVIAAEGPDQQGLYVMEDAHHVDLVDPDAHTVVPDGDIGNVCVTVLFKDDIFPVVRFDTNDLSAFDPTPSPLELGLRRLRGFLGRSDNMVKLRGINVYPTAVGELLQAQPETTGEFLCRVERVQGRDEMTVLIETRAPAERHPDIAGDYRALFRRKLGVEVGVELTAPGALTSLTGIESRQKPVRLQDMRASSD
jgi:phenylacetate-CoA ligase